MSLSAVAHTPRGIATIVLECVSYTAMLPFLYMEYRTIMEYWDDWLNAWNAIDVLVYSLQVEGKPNPRLKKQHSSTIERVPSFSCVSSSN